MRANKHRPDVFAVADGPTPLARNFPWRWPQKQAALFPHKREALSFQSVNLAPHLLADDRFGIPFAKRNPLSFRVTGEHRLKQHELAVVLKDIEPPVLVRWVIQASKKDSGNGRFKHGVLKRITSQVISQMEAPRP